MFVVVDTYT